MSDNFSQKSSDEPRIEINREDLFTYYLQKIWPVKHITFQEFEIAMQKKGVIVIGDEIPF